MRKSLLHTAQLLPSLNHIQCTLTSWQSPPLIVTHLALWGLLSSNRGGSFKAAVMSGADLPKTHISVTRTAVHCGTCTNKELIYLHELKGRLKVLHGIHFDPEELHAHDETDDALDHVGTLLFVPELFQFCDELLPHSLKPAQIQMYLNKNPTSLRTPSKNKKPKGGTGLLWLCKDSDDLCIQVCNDVHIASVGAAVPIKWSTEKHFLFLEDMVLFDHPQKKNTEKSEPCAYSGLIVQLDYLYWYSLWSNRRVKERSLQWTV